MYPPPLRASPPGASPLGGTGGTPPPASPTRGSATTAARQSHPRCEYNMPPNPRNHPAIIRFLSKHVSQKRNERLVRSLSPRGCSLAHLRPL
eukprot:600180-Prorocentrum_minimum.AAC.2